MRPSNYLYVNVMNGSVYSALRTYCKISRRSTCLMFWLRDPTQVYPIDLVPLRIQIFQIRVRIKEVNECHQLYFILNYKPSPMYFNVLVSFLLLTN